MDMFGRHENKILGLIEAGIRISKLVYENEWGDKYTRYFDNYQVAELSNDNNIIVFGGRMDGREIDLLDENKYDGAEKIIPLFDDNGDLKRNLFGSIKVKIIEMDRGYKPNTVFYGICEDECENEIIIKYGLKDRKLKNNLVGKIVEISPLDLIESDAYNKNAALIEQYGRKNNRLCLESN